MFWRDMVLFAPVLCALTVALFLGMGLSFLPFPLSMCFGQWEKQHLLTLLACALLYGIQHALKVRRYIIKNAFFFFLESSFEKILIIMKKNLHIVFYSQLLCLVFICPLGYSHSLCCILVNPYMPTMPNIRA